MARQFSSGETTTPVVSVIIPVFNREGLLLETLDLLARQTRNDWEVLVVDDGSTDGSSAVVAQRAAHDPRIQVFQRDRLRKGATPAGTSGWRQRAPGW